MNDLLLRTALGQRTERAPVWLMRQAGRILPEYRALRSRFPDFKAFVKTPEAAAEATLQPIEALGVDAAIVFSDILVIPEALGLDYEMVEAKGPRFPQTIDSHADVRRLASAETASERLGYVYEAIRLSKAELAGRVPLIGFAGAPWTLLAYMVEGGGSKTFSKARRFLYCEPVAAHALLQLLTDATIAYAKQQAAAGADLIQIFDSWAGELTPDQYRTFALPYLRQIGEALSGIPRTIFAKGAWFVLNELVELPYEVVGLDWNAAPDWARAAAGPQKVLQGNLDPCVLYAAPDAIFDQTKNMLRAFGPHHIANLGHGVYPDTPLEGVRAFVQAVKEGI